MKRLTILSFFAAFLFCSCAPQVDIQRTVLGLELGSEMTLEEIADHFDVDIDEIEESDVTDENGKQYVLFHELKFGDINWQIINFELYDGKLRYIALMKSYDDFMQNSETEIQIQNMTMERKQLASVLDEKYGKLKLKENEINEAYRSNENMNFEVWDDPATELKLISQNSPVVLILGYMDLSITLEQYSKTYDEL